jgi:phosphopantothenoylcysteine synthetase/decarboxylase
VKFVGPEVGKLADGRIGMGRMAEVGEILNTAKELIRK